MSAIKEATIDLAYFATRVQSLPEWERQAVESYLRHHFDEVLDCAKWQRSFDETPDEVIAKFEAEAEEANRNGTAQPSGPDRF